jgi:hypothetical protein
MQARIKESGEIKRDGKKEPFLENASDGDVGFYPSIVFCEKLGVSNRFSVTNDKFRMRLERLAFVDSHKVQVGISFVGVKSSSCCFFYEKEHLTSSKRLMQYILKVSKNLLMFVPIEGTQQVVYFPSRYKVAIQQKKG